MKFMWQVPDHDSRTLWQGSFNLFATSSMTTLYAAPDVKVNINFLISLTDYAFVPVLGHVGRHGERYANRKLTTLHVE